MELTSWLVIVPLGCLGCLAFLIGWRCRLACCWRLIRRYWVLIALVFTAPPAQPETQGRADWTAG